MSLYPLIRPLLFRLPAEAAHRWTLRGTRAALAAAPVRRHVQGRLLVDDPRLEVERWGIHFPNPVGLAAGFDKSGACVRALAGLGFGFLEIGTVTRHPQPGHPRPRLFRLPEDGALVNRMGFNNPGADAVAERLAGSPTETVLGINLGKSAVTPLERAAEDYLYTLERVAAHASYLVVNVSSPNTPGLRKLQHPIRLEALLRAVISGAGRLPVLVKLSPDLSDTELDALAELAVGVGAAGIVAVNTTVSRARLRSKRVAALGEGGVSGAPLRARALEVVRRIYRHTGGALPIIGVGGVFNAGDAWELMRAGASLVQLYTGLVYGGPGVVRRVNLGLLERVRKAGLPSLADAVGGGV